MLRLPLGGLIKNRPAPFVLIALCLAVACAGCARTFRPFGHTVPGPANAIAAAPLGGGRIAVLAGTDDAKGVFIIDELTAEVLRSFGVTKEATGIAAVAEEGPLLLSVGTERGGKPVGAVEEWTLDGVKSRVVALPTEGLSITRTVGHLAYALIGAGGDRAAVPINLPSLRVGTALPLDADARGLQQCRSSRGTFLLYTDGRGQLALRDLVTGVVARSSSQGEGATCAQGGDVAYAISGDILQRSISALHLPELQPFSSLPASRDAIALYQTDEQKLVSLNSANRVSSVQTFRDESIDLRTAANR
jgi:hypothetical protein